MLPKDPIGLIDLGYQPADTGEQWRRALLPVISEALDLEGGGAVAYEMTPSGPSDLIAVTPPQWTLEDMAALTATGFGGATPEQIQRAARLTSSPGLCALSEALETLVNVDGATDYRDSPAVVVHSGEGAPLLFASLTREVAQIDAPMRALWQRIAVHLGAGLRLAGRRASTDAPDVEFIADPDGKIVHQPNDPLGAEQQEQLRSTARAIDRAHTRVGRDDAFEALELWHGLLAGHWSLVDHFDSDGRRFLLGRRNEPDVPNPRQLTPRQRQAAFYASLGWSLKQIAWALGVKEQTVSTHLRGALAKLGLKDRAELVLLAQQIEGP